MKTKDIKDLSVDDLMEQLHETRSKLIKFKMSHTISPAENPMQIRHMRRDIARIKTELRKRELANK
ncbi:MAG: 50S ribosomal protein L29 [Flavobacteriales bacterium]|nr:50S ribosomal protein L29 [Flavobacteriales bacterium]